MLFRRRLSRAHVVSDAFEKGPVVLCSGDISSSGYRNLAGQHELWDRKLSSGPPSVGSPWYFGIPGRAQRLISPSVH